MSQQIVITKVKEHMVSAWMQNATIVEFVCNRIDREDAVGNIYLGIVKNIVKNINGAFVEFQKGVIGFLPIRKKNLVIGQEIIVQVKKEATREKKAMLTQQIELTGKYLVLTSDKTSIGISNKIQQKEQRQELKSLTQPLITQNYGFILRTSAATAKKEDVVAEAKMLAEKYEQILKKGAYRTPLQMLGTNRDLKKILSFGLDPKQIEKVITDQEEVAHEFEMDGYFVERLSEQAGDIDRRYRVLHYLKEALSKKVWMKSGGFLYVEQTEAMAVIDVNTGKSIGKEKKETHIRKTNFEAAREIARQIRLRNLSGIILVDFIDMTSKEDQEMLLQEMQQYLNKDSKKAVAVDITKLGLMEITRKRERNPINCQISLDNL